MSQMSNPKTAPVTCNSWGRRRKRSKMEKPDFTKGLPDDVLSHILSFLSIDEAVRCSVLSKKWLNLWKNTSHIEFNVKKMMKPLTQLLHSREPQTSLDSSLLIGNSVCKTVSRYGFLVYPIILRHTSDLSSCKFVHVWKSLVYGDVQSWIKVLLRFKKGVTNLSLECEPDYGEVTEHFMSKNNVMVQKPYFPPRTFANLASLELINYVIDCPEAFIGCINLKTLKLNMMNIDEVILGGILENCVALENFSLLDSIGFDKLIIINQSLKVLQLQKLCVDELKVSCQNLKVLLFDCIICEPNGVGIQTPNLTTFRSYCYSMYDVSDEEGRSILKIREILAHSSQEYPSRNVFINLSTLSLDLDLNHLGEVKDLYAVLLLCSCLQVLEISLPVFEHQSFFLSNDHVLPYPIISKFWERENLCYCVNKKLKFVCIRGFKGSEQEVGFVKYLISRATMMKRITIISNGLLEDADQKLFSLVPRASGNLSINFKFN
ncbi:hypothetical protein RIF29_37859 [Crotalaria pallida]|uniref:F-box domain-containing protein n=1 Tax=Crotalaria pallida TaxID=3830 RepID=A0AAN9HL04_CROPI